VRPTADTRERLVRALRSCATYQEVTAEAAGHGVKRRTAVLWATAAGIVLPQRPGRPAPQIPRCACGAVLSGKKATRCKACYDATRRGAEDGELVGARIGKLVVLTRVGQDQHGKALYRCRCDCGNETVTAAARLRRGQRGEPNYAARSCGCLRGRYDRKAARPVPDGPPCVQCKAKPAKKRSHWCGAACREAYEIRAAAGKVAWLED